MIGIVVSFNHSVSIANNNNHHWLFTALLVKRKWYSFHEYKPRELLLTVIEGRF